VATAFELNRLVAEQVQEAVTDDQFTAGTFVAMD
jgi:hypothetical protein